MIWLLLSFSWVSSSRLTCSSQQLSIGTKANRIDGKMTFGEDPQELSRRYAPHSDCGVGGTSCEVIAVGMKCDALEIKKFKNTVWWVQFNPHIDILSVTGIDFDGKLSLVWPEAGCGVARSGRRITTSRALVNAPNWVFVSTAKVEWISLTRSLGGESLISSPINASARVRVSFPQPECLIPWNA